MDLPNLFSTPETKSPFVIALLLTDASVQAALWKVDQGRIVIIEISDVHDYTDEKTCLVETDKALQELGPDSEHVTEVVFGFEPWWVSEAGIKDIKKPLLKKLTQELSLKAVGFVVVTEAFAQHLRSEDPLVSALTIYFSESSLALTLIRQGKVVQTEVVGRSGDSVADVVEGLAHFPVKKQNLHFPAKMLLLSHTASVDELEVEQQTLLSRTWTDDQTFLHPPVIELAPENTLIRVITEQGGRAVAEAQGTLRSASAEAGLAEISASPAVDQAVAAAKGMVETASEPDEAGELEAAETSSEFGFTTVTEDSPENTAVTDLETADEEHANLTAVDEAVDANLTSAKSFGVPISGAHLKAGGIGASAQTAVSEDDDEDEDEVSTILPTSAASSKNKWVWLTADRGYTRNDVKKFALIGFVAGLMAILIMAYLGLASVATALVSIKLASKPVSKQINITLDPAVTSSDTSKLLLAAQTVSREVKVSASVPVTGVKQVGEKAKGKVTLFNKTTSSKNFPAGTVLAAGNHQFTLDQAVTVASASVSQTSGGGGETKTYGKAEAAVTAVKIGPESNIAKDAALIVASFDSGTYSAESLAAFSGGTSQEKTVISEKDRQAVLAKAQAEAKKQAETEFKEESGNGTYFVPTVGLKTVTAEYSGKVGDEASELTLALTSQTQALSYRTEDLVPLAAAALADQVPGGYTLSTETPQVLSQPATPASSSAKTVISANISSQAVPQLSAEDTKNALKGQPLTQAQAQLVERAEIDQASIEIVPTFARWFVKSVPQDVNRIRVRITP